ncbi:hypothetical protein [Pedobacter sp.]|uniref:hypothetical protein n=1 Tax=Pedobacter sp. TaxID=1411316 RepID=UPI003C5417CF
MDSKKKQFNPLFLWGIIGLSSLVIGAYFLNIWPFKPVEPMKLHGPSMSLLQKKENNPTVKAYLNYIQEDRDKMSLDHEFSNKALLMLSAAIKAMATTAGYRLTDNLDEADVFANQIIVDPAAVTHADDIIKAGNILTRSLTSLQQSKYPSLSEASIQLRNALDGIDAKVQTLDQRKKVKTFFLRAAQLLNEMN